MTDSEILGIARITFAEGGAEEFERLSERCMEIVRTQDTGTLQYDVYLDEARTRAVVVERYRDSAALIEHLEHIGPELMAAVVACGEMEGETLGVPSPELRALMGENAVGVLLPHLSL